MKKVAIKVISDEGIRTFRDEHGNKLETIPGTEAQALDRMIEETERYSITPTTFNERTFEASVDNILFQDRYSFGETEVVRFGINAASSEILTSIKKDGIKTFDELGSRPTSTVKSGAYTTEHARAIPLASLENKILNSAISYLIKSETPTVLVDILARVNGGEQNGRVKIKGTIPETHTVVLYKRLCSEGYKFGLI